VTILLVALIITAAMVILLKPWPFFLTPEQSQALQERNIAAEFTKWVDRHAKARGLNVRGVVLQVPMECPKCGRSSSCFVYPHEVCERCWQATLPPRTPSAHPERHHS
jgi:hypothetical protein